MEVPNRDVPPDRDDVADTVFPNGKSASKAGKGGRSVAKTDTRKGTNVAKGNYDCGANKNGPSREKKRWALAPASPKPSRTPLQSGIYKLVQASVRCVHCVLHVVRVMQYIQIPECCRVALDFERDVKHVTAARSPQKSALCVRSGVYSTRDSKVKRSWATGVIQCLIVLEI